MVNGEWWMAAGGWWMAGIKCRVDLQVHCLDRIKCRADLQVRQMAGLKPRPTLPRGHGEVVPLLEGGGGRFPPGTKHHPLHPPPAGDIRKGHLPPCN